LIKRSWNKPYIVGWKKISKIMKKSVAFDIPLCYNNFCPLERVGEKVSKIATFEKVIRKIFLKTLKKLLTNICSCDILNELLLRTEATKHIDK
jgi:hypothetical protein